MDIMELHKTLSVQRLKTGYYGWMGYSFLHCPAAVATGEKVIDAPGEIQRLTGLEMDKEKANHYRYALIGLDSNKGTKADVSLIRELCHRLEIQLVVREGSQ